MNRPRLSFVHEYFQDIANKGNEEAQDWMSEYFDIKENQGEFLAGRFIIEVYIEMQKTLEENYNNERSTWSSYYTRIWECVKKRVYCLL